MWQSLMPNPAIADAILDRMIRTALRFELKGDSQRKKETTLDIMPAAKTSKQLTGVASLRSFSKEYST